jgi:hypothetical protein
VRLWDRLCFASNYSALFGDGGSYEMQREVQRASTRLSSVAEVSHKLILLGESAEPILPKLRAMQYGRTLRFAYAVYALEPHLSPKLRPELVPIAAATLFQMAQFAYTWHLFVLGEAITRQVPADVGQSRRRCGHSDRPHQTNQSAVPSEACVVRRCGGCAPPLHRTRAPTQP